MLRRGDRVIVAVSGGPDSTCLLHVLLPLAPALGVEVCGVAHFNHRLRGAESDEDERFVREMTERLGLTFFHQSAGDDPRTGNLEDHLRRERRDFFRSLINKGAATAIALGHTRDDQAETVLFRLLRGSGLSGLAGILPATAEGVVRPLLGSTRAEAESFLIARGLPWRRDSSNADPRFARNRIRRDLLPQLEREWNPRLRERLAHLADLAYEEERWWSRETSRLFRSAVQRTSAGIELHAGELASLPRAAARRVVREAIRQAKGDLQRIEFRHVEAIIHLVVHRPSGSGRLALPGLEAILSFDWLLLRTDTIEAPRSVAVTAPGAYPSPCGDSLIHLAVSRTVPAAGACVTLKADVPGRKAGIGSRPHCELQLRGWQAGDHYRPIGESHDRKLKEMFQRARVPSWRRPFWPILSWGQKIVWARGFGVAAEFAANPRVSRNVSKSESGSESGSESASGSAKR